MNALKRLGLFCFGVAGIFALVALTLPWLGPWTEQARAMLTVRWYYIALEACIGIAAAGLLVELLRALLTPRSVKAVVVAREGSGQITVRTSAIASQATHIVEEDGRYTVEHVRASARKHHVDVRMRVRPAFAVNVAEEGAALHERLVAGLGELAGDTIRSVDLEFVEPESLDAELDAAAWHESSAEGRSGIPATVAASSRPASPEAAGHADGSFDITVPMGHAAAGQDAAEGDESEVALALGGVSEPDGQAGAAAALDEAPGPTPDAGFLSEYEPEPEFAEEM